MEQSLGRIEEPSNPSQEDRSRTPWCQPRLTALGLAGLLTLAACGSVEPAALEAPTPPSSSASAPYVDTTATSPAEPDTSAAPPASSDTADGSNLPRTSFVQLDHHVDCAAPCNVLATAKDTATTNAPAWLMTVGLRGATATLPRRTGMTVYGVVLAGPVNLAHDGATVSLDRWHAFEAVGGGVALERRGNEDALVVLGLASSGPLAKALETTAWTQRPAPVQVLDFEEQQDLAWAGGKAHARLGFEAGAASFGLLLTDPDLPVPEHDHPTSWELLAMVVGDGAFSLDGASPRPIRSGAVVAVPSGTRHAFTPSGTDPLVAVQMYAPPGPEQRFKQLAADAP